MAYGIALETDLGSLAISESFKNPPLAASGNMTTTSLSFENFNSQASISYTRTNSSAAPLLAIRPTALTSILYVADTDTNTWTWTFYSEQAASTTIPYWIFDSEKAITALTSGYGIQVKDGSGNVLFNHATKPLRIVDIATKTLTDTLGGGGNTDFTYASGRTYAAILSRWAESNYYNLMNDETTRYWGAVQGITDGIRLAGSAQEVFAGTNPTPTGWNVMTCPIIDVTHY